MKRRGWIVVGVLLIVAGIFGLRQKREEPAAQAVPAGVRPSPIDNQLPRLPLKMVDDSDLVRTRTAEVTKSAGAPERQSFENVSGTDWAVVAAIYRQYEAAEKRAASLDDVHGIRPTVYPAKGQGTKYMVLLGSGLTRAKAEELRSRATGAGMPADTYVTKLRPQ